jgi:hypothetical protein
MISAILCGGFLLLSARSEPASNHRPYAWCGNIHCRVGDRIISMVTFSPRQAEGREMPAGARQVPNLKRQTTTLAGQALCQSGVATRSLGMSHNTGRINAYTMVIAIT